MLSELRTAMEVSSIYGVLIATGIMRTVKARVPVKPSAVSSAICQVMYRTSEIEEIPIGIYLVHTQVTYIVQSINRTEEIFYCQESCISRAGKYPAQVIVSFIQISVIRIKSGSIGTSHPCQIRIYSTQKIEVYFKQIIVLALIQVQFESHTVCQKAGIDTNIA